MKRILMIEDELSIIKIASFDLEKEGFEVDYALDGTLGYKKASEGDYDLLLVDWMLPNISGVEIIKRLREENYKKPIIFLTAKTQEEDIVQGLEAGADDYVTKPFSNRVLVARINAHLRRDDEEKIEKISMGDLVIDSSRYEVYLKDELIDLTKIEYQLLMYFVTRKNRAISRGELLSDLWGFEYDGDTRIVDVHVFKLRSKLKSDSFQFRSIRGVGYMIEEVE